MIPLQNTRTLLRENESSSFARRRKQRCLCAMFIAVLSFDIAFDPNAPNDARIIYATEIGARVGL